MERGDALISFSQWKKSNFIDKCGVPGSLQWWHILWRNLERGYCARLYTHGTAEKRGVIILMFLLVKCRAGDVSRRKEIFNWYPSNEGTSAILFARSESMSNEPSWAHSADDHLIYLFKNLLLVTIKSLIDRTPHAFYIINARL